jgi:hypothetical protein
MLNSEDNKYIFLRESSDQNRNISIIGRKEEEKERKS